VAILSRLLDVADNLLYTGLDDEVQAWWASGVEIVLEESGSGRTG
jgi:hypothetical protein